MSSQLDQKTVEHVARLARLKLSADEVADFSQQLSAVLENFAQISSVDTNGVKPMVTPTEMANVLRPDQIEVTNDGDAMLSNAAEKSGRLFKVPPVV